MANWRAISRKGYKMLQPAGICKSHDMELWTRSGVCLVWILPLLAVSLGTNYEIYGDEKTFDLTCNAQEDQGNIAFSKLVDISGLSFNIADDMETLFYDGDIKILKDLPPISMEIDVFRWQRSQWQPTLLSMKRTDFCKALTNPMEIWYPILKGIPKEQLKCPPKKGHIYSIRNVTNHLHVGNFPFLDVAGDLKAVIHLTAGKYKTCAVVFFKVYAN